MILLTIERKWPKPTYTIGRFYIDGIRLCESLEDTDRGLTDDMSFNEIKRKKIEGVTAIPKGTYKVVLSRSPKFCNRIWAAKWGGRTPEIVGVKGFSAIRIHPGTDENSTEGCPLVGDNTIKGKITNSQNRFHELMVYLVPRMDAGEECFITIK